MAASHSDHSHQQHGHGRAFAVGVGLNLAFVAAEAAFGLLAGSLALLADAGHNLSDVLGLAMAWGAVLLSRRPPTQRHTYGLRSTSILAALGNALLLLVAVGAICWEAIHRLQAPQPVQGATVIWVAAAGVAVNGITALLFAGGRKRDLNIRGAFLHMAADAAVSLGVVASGTLVLLTGKMWLDPLTSLLVAGVVFWSTWSLLTEALHLSTDAVPAGIDIAAVQIYLESLPGVVEVHDLHIWAMSTTETALTAHLVYAEPPHDCVLVQQASQHLYDRFGIDHVTLQVEYPEAPGGCAGRERASCQPAGQG
jgi:cobalt-zinc-cadmium efflux system protein